MGIKARLKRLERDHGGKLGEAGIPPLEVLVAMVQEEERKREAEASLIPPLEDLVAQLQREENEHNHPIERVICAKNEYPENA